MIRRIDPSEFPEDPPEESRLSEPPPAPEQRTPKAGDLRARIEQIRKLAAEGGLDPGDLPAFGAAAAPPARAPKGGPAYEPPPAPPPPAGYPVRSGSKAPGRVSLADYIEQLKRTVAGESIVHERTIPPQPEAHAERIDHLGPGVARVVEAAGVGRLYSHQEEGLRHIGEGRNVVVATPTASGKSLIYNAAVLSSLLADPRGRALYVFPLKALEQDQHAELQSLLAELNRGSGGGLRAAIYDGDTKPHERRKIRENPPHILITTPDMLHGGILAFRETWESFLADLRFVVLDELHAYSGIFGSHVLHVVRRLNRICAACGSDPRYIACSATIGNPAEFAARLCNREFTEVTESGAPAAARHFLFLNPPESPNTAAARLLQLSVSQGFRSIVFTRARVVTELIYRWATQARPDLRDRISSYRAGYMPEERREIEARLVSGDLLGVVSTSALELGIDIGGLDVCVLVGYPGSIVNTWQRAGRVGRCGRESLVLLIAGRDALDQFFMAHPRHLFQRRVENAVADPSNRYILQDHLACAARELPLAADEPEYAIDGYREALDELTAAGTLLRSADGDAWFAARRQPHRLVSMRSIGESWNIVHGRRTIGSVSGGQLYGECYEGAIYLHRGRQYLIGERNPARRQIEAEAVDVPWYTRPKYEKETEIVEELRARPMHGYMARLGRLLVSSQVIAYEKVRVGDQAILGRHPLESPVQQFETVGFWIEMDAPFKKQLKRRGFHHMGSLHAVEHAVKSLFPMLALSKQTDVGGICYPLHPQLGKGAVFIYDQYPGGIGLAETGYDMLDRLFSLTLEMVACCDCAEGCPSCIHFPTCGAGNHPLDKAGGIHLLELLTGRRSLDEESLAVGALEEEPPLFADWELEKDREEEEDPPGTEESPHVVVFDLETQLSAAEVGGWNKTSLMRVSCGIAWDSREDRFITYFEDRIDELIALLQRADLVVGFNVIGFDYSVLRGYSRCDFRELNTLDILREVHAHLNYRVSLQGLAAATLNARKTADGLQALRWWKQGRLDLIEEYCRHDVQLTRDLFRHGLDKGFLLFDRKNEGRMRVPVDWREQMAAAASAARAN